MRFSEIFLRLGCALVAWMVLYAHFVWLAALGAVGCGPDGDELHRLLLGLVPFTIGFSFLLRMTRPFTDIHLILRWLGVPLAVLMTAGAYQVILISHSVYATGHGICSTSSAATWHQIWGPAQLLAIVVSASMIIRIWRTAAAARKE
jgi:hypothetical protein